MTVFQYLILSLLEKLDKPVLVSELVDRLGEKDYIILSELTGLIFGPSFNPKRSKTAGLINADISDDKQSSIELSHTISINKNFCPNNLKFTTVPGNYKKPEDVKEKEEQMEAQNIKAYHNMVLDACLTRIMKGRIGKKTTHLELVNDAAKQVELFIAQPSHIKDRIENLIEKGILKREENDHNLYSYIS